MKKDDIPPYRFESLSDLHRVFGLPKPLHPMISLLNWMAADFNVDKLPKSHIGSFYKISFKANLRGKLKYGQHYYDFDEGGLIFVSPNQLVTQDEDNGDHRGYTLLIHPDFFLSYPLAKKIRQYSFFSYATHEALHLSEKEKNTILSVFSIIEEELNLPIDDFSQEVIIAQIELLLNYCNRYYRRQFNTRKAVNSDVLQKLEAYLDTRLSDEALLSQGIPTVQALAKQVHLSPGYLSDMLRSLTGQNTQQHIHNKLIEKAKGLLSATQLTSSEIAYQLGFGHSQSFSRLFKAKTNLTPLEFRQSFG